MFLPLFVSLFSCLCACLFASLFACLFVCSVVRQGKPTSLPHPRRWPACVDDVLFAFLLFYRSRVHFFDFIDGWKVACMVALHVRSCCLFCSASVFVFVVCSVLLLCFVCFVASLFDFLCYLFVSFAKSNQAGKTTPADALKRTRWHATTITNTNTIK